ncbi:MAG: shikimate dehydrogenase [Firmicutes bacterium]|nr:shikimate dehydrogenase [Bacillota bacterium]MBR6798898.1 shikimate dehydrogenase [Bacillota bacterium]
MKYGLIGRTLAHSYSKEIHEALGKYSYGLFSLEPEGLTDFISARNFSGLNVTIPYKKDVIPLCDEVSDLARAIGSVNTLYWKDHLLVGHNTDYEGFLYTAKRSGISFAGKTVLIMGNGGTSLTARKAAADEGAKKIYVASRSSKSEHITYDKLPAIAGDINIIVNTTPVGTFPNNLQSIIDIAAFPDCEAVIDVIYNPFKTKLLMDAEKAGLKTANGLPMLVAQATAAAGYFLGTPGAFESENEKIIDKMVSNMRNIVLIGMPGCGKSTIGRIISEKTGKEFVDMDDEIVKKAGKPIPEIFEEVGEPGFRDIESQVAAELGKQRGLVIATGGGAILREENVYALKQNGLMIHIKRPLEELAMNGRPLSKDIEALRKMEAVRMPIYEAAADMTIDNS